MGQPVVHFEIVGKDLDRLCDYYAQLFGWRIEIDHAIRYGLVAREENLTSDGIGIGGGLGAGAEGYGGHVTVYIEVPDVEATLAQAERLGGSRMMGPHQVTEGVQIGLVQDPEGHTIGLIQGQSRARAAVHEEAAP